MIAAPFTLRVINPITALLILRGPRLVRTSARADTLRANSPETPTACIEHRGNWLAAR